jgi:hypothetical protein
MHRSRLLLPAAPLLALGITTAQAAGYPTAGTATLNGTATGSPTLIISGAMHGDLEIVDPVQPVGQANLVIDDTCSLSTDSLAATGSFTGACSGTVSIQMSGGDTKAGAELAGTGVAAINSHDWVNVALACTVDAPYAACSVSFQG